MKKYIILSLVISSVTLGGNIVALPAFSQSDAETVPISPDNPIVEQHDPNQVIKNERMGKVVPEKIKPYEDDCADELNKEELANGKPAVSKDYKKKCLKRNKQKNNSPVTKPLSGKGGY